MNEQPFYYQYKCFEDNRGSFSVAYNADDFAKLLGRDVVFTQDNTAYNKKKNTFRGFHWQNPPYAQAKLIRCVKGEIIDIIIDIRKESPTYGKTFHFQLKEGDSSWLYVPVGFAHGYITVVDDTMVEYKVDNKYNKESERGLYGIERTKALAYPEQVITSEKDELWPKIDEIDSPFTYN